MYGCFEGTIRDSDLVNYPIHQSTLTPYVQLIGYSDEVLDLAFVGQNETHLAVATNSKDLKVYRLEDLNCQILQGHTDFIMALSTCKAQPDIFASASKVQKSYFLSFFIN